MTKELKQKWVDALRSGKYPQGFGKLRQYDNYCCLGVLCDISGLGRWLEPSNNGTYTFFPTKGEPTKNYLPQVLADMGLGQGRTLTVLNDTHEWTFAQIADYIEKEIPVDDEIHGKISS